VTFDFWPDCGHHLLQADERGWLLPTRRLPGRLDGTARTGPGARILPRRSRPARSPAARPHAPGARTQLAALLDADARENYTHFISAARRAAAGRHAAGLAAAALAPGPHPGAAAVHRPHRAGRGARLLDGENAFEARAGEMLFRRSASARTKADLLAGDQETLDLQRETLGFGDLGRLLAQAALPVRAQQMQVLQPTRQQPTGPKPRRPGGRHVFLLDLTHEVKQELGHGLSFQLTHALGPEGAGQRAGALGSALAGRGGAHHAAAEDRRRAMALAPGPGRRGQPAARRPVPGPGRRARPAARLLSLFRLDFDDAREMRPDVAGKPVYLGLMATTEQVLRIKPQNLLLNLPLAAGRVELTPIKSSGVNFGPGGWRDKRCYTGVRSGESPNPTGAGAAEGAEGPAWWPPRTLRQKDWLVHLTGERPPGKGRPTEGARPADRQAAMGQR
jgi:hypothetical protein